MILKQPTQPVKETTVILFGSKHDPEVKRSINKIAITKRKTEIMSRPNFDAGMGPCGKFICSCKGVCLDQFSTLEKKFG